MPRRALQPRANICQLCEYMIAPKAISRQHFRSQRPVYPTRAFSTGRRICSQKPTTTNSSTARANKVASAPASGEVRKNNGTQATVEEVDDALAEVKRNCNSLLTIEGIPSEDDILLVLGKCEAMAKLLTSVDIVVSPKSKIDGATSALLSLDESDIRKISYAKLPNHINHMVDELSSLAYSIVCHPPIFIGPKVLALYVEIQAILGKPKTLPDVLHLYANKPVPEDGSSPIRYLKQNPNKLTNAIPTAVADRALQNAINSKNLAAAMDIIELSYCATASRRAKILSAGLVPAAGLALLPVGAYSIATHLSALQSTMDSAMATQVAFAGILAYLGLTATVGVVAITTANDQMDRVTWAMGVPLRERWFREEERAAIDKVAGAWGFRESWRRGEEEGDDWEIIREWIGRRSMMLDKTELMEGME